MEWYATLFLFITSQIYGKHDEKSSAISVKIVVFILTAAWIVLIIAVVQTEIKIAKAEPITTGAGKFWWEKLHKWFP